MVSNNPTRLLYCAAERLSMQMISPLFVNVPFSSGLLLLDNFPFAFIQRDLKSLIIHYVYATTITQLSCQFAQS